MSDKLFLILTCKFISFSLVSMDSVDTGSAARYATRYTTTNRRPPVFIPIRETSEVATQTSPIFTITTPPIDLPESREVAPTPRRLIVPVQVAATPSPVHYHAASPETPESSASAIITALVVTALIYKYIR